MSKGREDVHRFILDGRSKQRTEARAYVEAEESLAPLRRVERQPRPGEPIEPIGPF